MSRASPATAMTTIGWLVALSLIVVPGLIVLAQAQPSTAAARVVSLDLCSDWLLAQSVTDRQVVLLSPLSRRYPAPWMDADWPAHDGSLEQILAARPGLVVVGEFNATMLRRRLDMLAVRTLVTRPPESLEELEEQLRRFLAALTEAGVPTVARPEALLPPASARPRPDPPPADSAPRLLLLGPNGLGTGPNTFEADLIRTAGWRNYLERPGHQPLDLERLVHDPPEAVIWAAPPHPALANRFAQHRALARALPPDRWLRTDYWRWQCPGPWSFSLARQLQP